MKSIIELFRIEQAVHHINEHENSSLTHFPMDKNCHHFADGIFQCIPVNEKFHILIKISLKYVPEGPIDNNPTLV